MIMRLEAPFLKTTLTNSPAKVRPIHKTRLHLYKRSEFPHKPKGISLISRYWQGNLKNDGIHKLNGSYKPFKTTLNQSQNPAYSNILLQESQLDKQCILEVIGRLQQLTQFLHLQSKKGPRESQYEKYASLANVTLEQIAVTFQETMKFLHQKLEQKRGQRLTRSCRHFFEKLNKIFFAEELSEMIGRGDKKQLILNLLELDTNLYVLNDYFDSIFQMEMEAPKDYIQSLPEDQQSRVTTIQLSKSSIMEFKTKEKYLRRMIMLTISAVVNQHSQQRTELAKKIIFGLSYPMFLVDVKSAQIRAYQYLRRPKIQNILNVFRIPERGFSQYFPRLTYPLIREALFIYIPRNYEPDADIFQRREDSLRILVLNHQRLARTNQGKKQTEIDTVVVYVHGGGFISMNSELVQTYSRKWANELEVPFLCLDYSKAPDRIFPAPVDDCQACYKFVAEHLHKYLNIRPKKIVLCGDSAGGNLVCALTIRLIKQNYPIMPQAMLLIYPSTNLQNHFCSSYLNGIRDGIISVSLLDLCRRVYVPKAAGRLDRHIEASPILLKEHTIDGILNPLYGKWSKKWPKTTFMVGDNDPLLDDSLNFFKLLTEQKVDTKLLLYKGLSHGFMNFSVIVPECKPAVRHSIEQLRLLLNKNNEKNEK